MRRRELFSSLASSFKKEEQQEKIIRPPYFEDESIFLTNCIECENTPCSTVCEENIIVIQDDNTPKLDLTISGCTYCDDCAEACPNEVLDVEFKKNIDAKIEINIEQCLAWNQTMCFSCKDPCLDDAIEFIGLFRPEINDKCTSCGYCIKYCPADAIKIVG